MANSTLITDYVGRGTHANRPTTPTIPTGSTALYYETDTDKLFAWDGSAWVQITGSLDSISDGEILANISGASAAPVGKTVSAVLDSALGSTQGNILYRNATEWTVLAPGTSGQVLQTGGAAANPSWTTVSGTGTVTSVATGSGLTGGPVTTTGTISLASIANGDVLANISGVSAAPIANPLSDVIDSVLGSTQGDILYRNATGWTVLAPGTSGQVLQSGGASADPSWADASSAGFAGPIRPSSIYIADTAGRLSIGYYAGAGGNSSSHDQGLQVEASLDADATFELRFPMPPTIPTGTMKLRLLSLASATTGALKFTPADAIVSAGSSPSAATLTSETQQTITWATGNSGEYIETKLALTPTPTGNSMLVMALTFNTTGTTLAQISTHIPTIVWE